MMLYSLGFAPMVFSALPAEDASRFIRPRFPGTTGGRMSTRRIPTSGGEAYFDHGAQYFTVRNDDFQLNPMNANPLRDLVEESIDFASVRACTAFELFISATNVETGKVKVFPRGGCAVNKEVEPALLDAISICRERSRGPRKPVGGDLVLSSQAEGFR